MRIGCSLLFAILFFFSSCKNSTKKNAPRVTKELKKSTIGCNNKANKPKLFLKFWAEMTKDEFHCISDSLVSSNTLSKHNDTLIYSILPYNNAIIEYRLSIIPEFIKDKLFRIIIGNIPQELNEKLHMDLVKKYGISKKYVFQDQWSFIHKDLSWTTRGIKIIFHEVKSEWPVQKPHDTMDEVDGPHYEIEYRSLILSHIVESSKSKEDALKAKKIKDKFNAF